MNVLVESRCGDQRELFTAQAKLAAMDDSGLVPLGSGNCPKRKSAHLQARGWGITSPSQRKLGGKRNC